MRQRFPSSWAAAAFAVALLAVACGTGETVSLTASAPFTYRRPPALSPSLERIAILVTLANHSADDLQIDPAEFAVRDDTHRIYPANAEATVADARSVSLAASQIEMGGILPLRVVTLRKDDILSGYVVFDVPRGVRPIELIFRQTDNDHVVKLDSAR